MVILTLGKGSIVPPLFMRGTSSGGILVAPMIHGSIMITLPPGVVILKAAWLYHRSSVLLWALAPATNSRQAPASAARNRSIIVVPPIHFRCAELNTVFRSERAHFPVNRPSPTMRCNIEGELARR